MPKAVTILLAFVGVLWAFGSSLNTALAQSLNKSSGQGQAQPVNPGQPIVASVFAPAAIQPKMPAALALLSIGSDAKTSLSLGAGMTGTLDHVSFGADANRAPIFELVITDSQINQAARNISIGAYTVILEDVTPSFVSLSVPPKPGDRGAPTGGLDQAGALAKLNAEADAAKKALRTVLAGFGYAMCTVYGADSDRVPLVRCKNARGVLLSQVLIEAGVARPRVSTQRQLMP